MFEVSHHTGNHFPTYNPLADSKSPHCHFSRRPLNFSPRAVHTLQDSQSSGCRSPTGPCRARQKPRTLALSHPRHAAMSPQSLCNRTPSPSASSMQASNRLHVSGARDARASRTGCRSFSVSLRRWSCQTEGPHHMSLACELLSPPAKRMIKRVPSEK